MKQFYIVYLNLDEGGLMSSQTIIEKILSGEFIVSVQIDPPTMHTNNLMEVLEKLKLAGVQVVDVNSSRRLSADSLHVASAIERDGFLAIPHITARDASTNGLVNQCFGAYTYGGVRNFLVITGDPYEGTQSFSNQAGVFHEDSIGILNALHTYLRMRPREPLKFTLGAAINQNEVDRAREGMRLQAKLNAGANFFMSQPVFTAEEITALNQFAAAYGSPPLLIGIWPLVNQKTIEAIYQNKIVGVKIPQKVYDEAQKYFSNTNDLESWGLTRAYVLIRKIREEKLASGVYIVAPSRNPLTITPLVQAVVSQNT